MIISQYQFYMIGNRLYNFIKWLKRQYKYILSVLFIKHRGIYDIYKATCFHIYKLSQTEKNTEHARSHLSVVRSIPMMDQNNKLNKQEARIKKQHLDNTKKRNQILNNIGQLHSYVLKLILSGENRHDYNVKYLDDRLDLDKLTVFFQQHLNNFTEELVEIPSDIIVYPRNIKVNFCPDSLRNPLFFANIDINPSGLILFPPPDALRAGKFYLDKNNVLLNDWDHFYSLESLLRWEGRNESLFVRRIDKEIPMIMTTKKDETPNARPPSTHVFWK